VTLDTRKAKNLLYESSLSNCIGTRLPFTSIPQPGFQQLHTSSRPRRYCQKPQSPDSLKDFPKEYPWNSYLCHLKYHVTRMPDHLGSYLDELVPECPKRPRLHRLGQCQTSQEIAEVVSQSKEMKTHLIIHKIMTRKPRPVQGVLTFLNPLLGCASVVVELYHNLLDFHRRFVTMKLTRGKSSPACHSILATTLRGMFQLAA